MSSSKTGLFVAWRVFQRRTESLADKFNLHTEYYYYPWEEKSKLHKAWSYIYKTIGTISDLVRIRPQIIFLQLPPTPALYIVAAYCRLSGCKFVADCHNAMIYSRWLAWPFAKSLLRKADALLVHNEDVEHYAKKLNLDTITLRDPLPDLSNSTTSKFLVQYDLKQGTYVIVPWSFSADEPIRELVQAAKLMPQTKFVMTWFAEKMPDNIRDNLPANLILTGYLDEKAFNTVFSHAGAALVLTTREGTQPSGASEAIVLGVPLIISDMKTTRKLYEDMPVYVENSTHGIMYGVRKALKDHDELIAKILLFGEKYSEHLENEIEGVKISLGITH